VHGVIQLHNEYVVLNTLKDTEDNTEAPFLWGRVLLEISNQDSRIQEKHPCNEGKPKYTTAFPLFSCCAHKQHLHRLFIVQINASCFIFHPLFFCRWSSCVKRVHRSEQVQCCNVLEVHRARASFCVCGGRCERSGKSTMTCFSTFFW
jgi:hypothetical protein